MPTYLDPEGKIIQTGSGVGSHEGTWWGFQAIHPHNWKSSFSIFAYEQKSGVAYKDESSVLADMGFANLDGLKLISGLPEVITHVDRLIEVEGDIS